MIPSLRGAPSIYYTFIIVEKPIVIVDGITESAAKVHVIPAAGTEKDFIYKAQITGLESTHSCKITHDTPHWECFLTKLTPATHYNLKVFRCAIDSSNCEKVLDGSFKSAMEGKSLLLTYVSAPGNINIFQPSLVSFCKSANHLSM